MCLNARFIPVRFTSFNFFLFNSLALSVLFALNSSSSCHRAHFYAALSFAHTDLPGTIWDYKSIKRWMMCVCVYVLCVLGFLFKKFFFSQQCTEREKEKSGIKKRRRDVVTISVSGLIIHAQCIILWLTMNKVWITSSSSYHTTPYQHHPQVCCCLLSRISSDDSLSLCVLSMLHKSHHQSDT